MKFMNGIKINIPIRLHKLRNYTTNLNQLFQMSTNYKYNKYINYYLYQQTTI